MAKKPHGSIHHMRPISRGGKRTPENELTIDVDFHNAWHTLFGNLFLDEVITLIEKLWTDKSGRIQEKYLVGEFIENRKGEEKDKRLSAWKVICEDVRSASEAVKIIKDKFTKRT